MQALIWRHFRFEHPEDWQMLHYSRDAAVGRCALADRYQFRLEFHWRRFAAVPDLDRILSDYRDSLERDDNDAVVRRAQHGPWRGLETESNGVAAWRFGRFFSVESCLVELVFVWPDRSDRQLAHSVLDSVREEPARQGLRRWRAFGMDMHVPEDLALQECKIEPARAEMVFASPGKGGREETFRRLGMVDHWLNAPVGDWLHVQRPDKARDCRSGSGYRANHSISTVVATLPARWPGRLLGRRGAFQAAAWLCPVDERLYCMTLTSPQPVAEGPEVLAGGRLACCDDLARQR